jgi:monoamine oxidase
MRISPSPPSHHHPLDATATPAHVLVVGGGFAGLAAARTLLQQQPQTKVTLLEAKDRLGGRLHSICLEGSECSTCSSSSENDPCSVWADLGGMFWHGNTGNVLKALSEDFPHLAVVPSGGDSAIPGRESAQWLRYPTGENKAKQKPVAVTEHEQNRSTELYKEWQGNMQKRYQHEVADKQVFTPAETSQLLSSWKADFLETLASPLDVDLLNLHLTMSFEMDRGIHWENHTLTSLDQDWDWVEIQGEDMIAQQGMQSYVREIAKDISNRGGRLLCNQRVTHIEYSSASGGCTITTESGRVFGGDFCVVAVPLGVLKERAAKMFTPPLPALQMDALNRAGIGVLNTLIVQWNRALPNISSNAYYFLQSPHQDNPFRHGFSCPSNLRQDRATSPKTITQFHFSETKHNFDNLMYWKEKALEIVNDVVDEVLTVDDILSAHLSRWHLDPVCFVCFNSKYLCMLCCFS